MTHGLIPLACRFVVNRPRIVAAPSTNPKPSAQPSAAADASAKAAPKRALSPAAAALAARVDAMPSRELLAWMFGFLSPVKPQVFFASLWLALCCGAEVLTLRQSGIAVDSIQRLRAPAAGAGRRASGRGSGAGKASR